MRKINCLAALLFCVILPIFSFNAIGAVGELQITDKTNPKITELYNQLQEKRTQVASLQSERHDALEENYQAMHENEQRFENRALGATTSAATGLGAMQLAEGIAEQNADRAAEEDMNAYIATMKCTYGKGQEVELGNQDVTLPGGNELVNLYTEYKQTAERLKATKKALGLRAGIENEVLYDKAQTGLYQHASVGRVGGGYTSLYNALTDETGADAAAWASQKDISAQKVKAGVASAGGGVIAGIAGNIALNKDAPKESSDKINQEYDAKVSKINAEAETIEQDLDKAIKENAQQVQEYNQKIQQLQQQVDEIKAAPEDCQEPFAAFVTEVSGLELIENELDSVRDVTLPEMDSDLLKECVQCKNKGAIFDPTDRTCECPPEKPDLVDGKCIAKTIEIKPIAPKPLDNEPSAEIIPKKEEAPEADYCPKTGNTPKSINDTHKVGDSCESDIISEGTITKRKNGTCTCYATGCWSPYTPTKNGTCVKQQSASTSTSAKKKTNEFVDENGYCKPYKLDKWFFNKETNTDISNQFQKLCDQAAKAHNCKRTDANTKKLLEKDNGAVHYEYICNAKSEDALKIQDKVNQNDSKLKYENVCKANGVGQFGPDNSDVYRVCTDSFYKLNISDFDTQVAIAKAYCKERLKQDSVACSTNRDQSGNDYYLKCNTRDDKNRFTFKFNGTSHSGQNTPASFNDITHAACIIHKVEYKNDTLGVFCSYRLNLKNNKDPICEKINDFAQNVGYFAQAESGKGCVLHAANSEFERGGNRTKATKGERRTAFGIDNNMFQNIDANMDDWLYNQMRVIVEDEMKNAGHSDPLYEFDCKQRDNDNVLTCDVNGRPIDFAFHKLGRVWQRRSNASKEGLTCIFGSHGKYDGRKCWGLTKEQCINELNVAIKQNATNCPSCGADWIDPPGMCSLTKSTRVEKTDIGLQIAGNAALMAVGAVITVFTEGIGTPFLVLTSIETAGLITEAWSGHGIRNKADRFLAKTSLCNNATCAEELLDEEEVRNILQLENDLNEKQIGIIDDELYRLLELMPENTPMAIALANQLADKPNCNFWNKLNPSAQCDWLQVVNALGQVAQFASLGYGLGRAGIKLTKAHSAMKKMAQQTARLMSPDQAEKVAAIDAKIAKNNAALKNANLSAAEKRALRADNVKQKQLRYDTLYGDTPKTGGPSGSAPNGNKGSSSNTNNKGNNTNGGQNGSGKTNTGGSKTENTGGGAAHGTTTGNKGKTASLHPDVANYRSAKNLKSAKHQLLQKYHPDKVAQYNSKELTELSENITRKVTDIDNLSEAEIQELSSMMKEYDKVFEVSKAANEAKAAVDAAKASTGTGAAGAKTGAKSTEEAATAGRASNNANNVSGAKSKGTTEPKTNTVGKTANNNTSGTTTGTSAGRGAANAERKTVAQIKKDVAGNEFDNFVKWVKEGKNTPPTLNASDATDEGWELLNKSLADEHVQLVDDGYGNKIFVYDSSAAKTGTGATGAKTGTKSTEEAATAGHASNNANNVSGAKSKGTTEPKTNAGGKTANNNTSGTTTGTSAGRGAANAERKTVAQIKKDVADTGRGTTKNADDVLDEFGKKPKENDIKTGADGIETINPTAQKLKEFGFSENNGVFVSKRTLYSDEIKSQLDSMSDWKWTYLSVDGSSEGEKIYIAMSKETAAKQGLQWSDEAEDFIRTFNSQSTTNINKAKQLVSSGKPLTDVNGVPVYVRNFGKYRDKPIIMVEINGKKLPFYVSGGSGGKTTVATGKWEFFGGIGPDSWFNKSRNLDKIEHHYYSSELEKIAKALDSQVGDVRNVEYVMMSQGRVSLNGTGKVGGINGVTELSDDLINSGIEELGFIPRMGWMDGADENIEGVKSWLSKQRASAPSGGAAKSTGTNTSDAKGATKSNAGATGAKINTAFNEFDDMLSHSNTLKNLNTQGRLQWVTSSSLNGKQYMRIRMGKNPDMNEAQKIIQNLRNEGFYVSSNTAQGGEKFLGVSSEDIFTPWNKSSNNWAFNHIDDMGGSGRDAINGVNNASQVDDVVEITPEIFDARNLRVSDGSGRLYVRNSAKEMLGRQVSGSDAVSEVNNLYTTIRRGTSYQVNDTKVSKAVSAMEKQSNIGNFVLLKDGHWNRMYYRTANHKGIQYHVSLNVDVDETLINKLNKLITKDNGKHIAQYKIPPVGSSRWGTMADPLTIYMSETSPEIERAIAEIARPYVRTSSDIGLLGRKIDNGVAIAYETSGTRTDIVDNIIQQIAKKDSNVAYALNTTIIDGDVVKQSYSVGHTEALRVWASDFLGYEIKPVTP